jgi:hypothetical protein
MPEPTGKRNLSRKALDALSTSARETHRARHRRDRSRKVAKLLATRGTVCVNPTAFMWRNRLMRHIDDRRFTSLRVPVVRFPRSGSRSAHLQNKLLNGATRNGLRCHRRSAQSRARFPPSPDFSKISKRNANLRAKSGVESVIAHKCNQRTNESRVGNEEREREQARIACRRLEMGRGVDRSPFKV